MCKLSYLVQKDPAAFLQTVSGEQLYVLVNYISIINYFLLPECSVPHYTAVTESKTLPVNKSCDTLAVEISLWIVFMKSGLLTF